MQLAAAAHILWSEVFEKHYTSSFTDNSQNESVSVSQDHWFSYDSNSKNKLTENTHIPSTSLSQIIHFNTVCQRQNSGTSRLTSAHETQLSIYVVFLLHSQTRSHLLVYKFHDLGLSLSYEQY